MDGIAKVPETPKIVFPFKIFPATQSVTADERIETEPPEVYPAGIVTEPDLVEIVPPVAPLFAMFPVSSPVDPYAFFPFKMSLVLASALSVSKKVAVPDVALGICTLGTLEYVTPLIFTFCAIFLLTYCQCASIPGNKSIVGWNGIDYDILRYEQFSRL